jgi:hypothetical protein
MILLLGVMVLNICKYQLPYIEYDLFREYIVENLCIQRFEANNECHGKCFLNKQIDLVNESGNSAGNTTEKEQITFETDDYVIAGIAGNEQHFNGKIHTTLFLINSYININLDIPMPPPKRFV